MFLDSDFLYDAGIPAIREHLRQKLAYLCLHGFSGPSGPNGGFGKQNKRRGGAMFTPTNWFLLLGVAIAVPLLAKMDQEMRP